MTRLIGACLAGLVAGTPVAAAGQGTGYGSIGLVTSHAYETNLFATPDSRGPRDDDMVTRIGPLLEAGYRSDLFQLTTRYEAAAERYWTHRALDRRIGRQHGEATLAYRPARGVTVGGGASFIRTQTPLELGAADVLVLGRIPAERLTIRPTLASELGRRVTLFADYEFARESLAAAGHVLIHTPRVAVQTSPDPATTYRVEYRTRRFAPPSGSPAISHSATVGVARSVGRFAQLELAAGPRISRGTARPEVAASVRRSLRRGELSLGFAETDTSILGEQGLMRLRRLRAGMTIGLSRYVTLTVEPTLFRTTRGDQSGAYGTVRAVELRLVSDLARGVALEVGGYAGQQRGNLGGTFEQIPYYRIGSSLRLSYPGDRARGRPAEPEGDPDRPARPARD